MIEASESSLAPPPARLARRLPAMPVPHEHGAWAWLYAPLVVGTAGSAFAPLPALLLVVAVTGAFFAQNTAALLARGRAPAGTGIWLALHLAMMAAGALPLILVCGHTALVGLGAAGGLFFLRYLRLITRRELKRQVRSERMEMLTIATLALTAPAGWLVARGALEPMVWLLWAACVLFFGSSVFYVKMWFAAAKRRVGFDAAVRREAGRPAVRYHLMMAAMVVVAAVWMGGVTGILLGAAFAPVVARAFLGRLWLAPTMPSLRRIGVQEVIYTLWFTGCLVYALRGAAS